MKRIHQLNLLEISKDLVIIFIRIVNGKFDALLLIAALSEIDLLILRQTISDFFKKILPKILFFELNPRKTTRKPPRVFHAEYYDEGLLQGVAAEEEDEYGYEDYEE